MADEYANDPTAATVEVVIAEISVQRQHELKELAGRIQSRRKTYKLMHDYYDGEHKVRLTPRARKYLQASGLQYAHNFSDVIVDSLVQRLQVTGVTVRIDQVDEATGADTAAAKKTGAEVTRWVRKQLDGAGFDQLQNIAHDAAVKLGDAYVTGWWDAEPDDGRGPGPRITTNKAEACIACYDDDDCIRPDSVAKLWEQKDHAGQPLQRLNVYFADRVEKYQRPSGDGDFSKWLDAVGEAWPMPWTRADGTRALGLAMVHMRNKNRGERYGRSEIRKAIPQQDALNKRMVDLDLISDTQGYAQRYATGLKGIASVTNTHPGAVWKFDSPDVKVGQFPAGDLTQIIAAIDMSVQHFAGTTGTPYHLLNLAGGTPSGEALKTAEAPLVKKVADRVQTFTDCWRDLIRLLIRMAIDQGALALSIDEEAALEVDISWASPESQNAESDWKVVEAKQAAGVSKHTTLGEMDYNADRESELRKDEQDSLGATLLTQFDAGTAPGTTPDQFGQAAA